MCLYFEFSFCVACENKNWNKFRVKLQMNTTNGFLLLTCLSDYRALPVSLSSRLKNIFVSLYFTRHPRTVTAQIDTSIHIIFVQCSARTNEFGCTTIFVSEHSPCSARLLMLSISHPQHVSVLYMWKTCISLRLATLFALYCAH